MKLIQNIEQALPYLKELNSSSPTNAQARDQAKNQISTLSSTITTEAKKTRKTFTTAKKAKALYPAKTLLAYPCEEVYALGCSPFAEENIDFLIKLKGRSPEQGFVIVAPSQYSVSKLTDLSSYNFSKLEYKELPKLLKTYVSEETVQQFLFHHLETYMENNYTSSCMIQFCGNLIDYVLEGLDYQALEFFDKETLLAQIAHSSQDLLRVVNSFIEYLLTLEDFKEVSLGANDFLPFLLDVQAKEELNHSLTKDDMKVFKVIKAIFSLPLVRQIIATALLKLSISKVPITFVLPKKASVTNKHLYGKHGTLAIRFPIQAELRDLLNQTGPLVSTSANLHGSEPLTSSEQILEVFSAQPDTDNIFVLEGNIISNKIPSVIVDLKQGIFYRNSQALLDYSLDPQTSKLLLTLLNL